MIFSSIDFLLFFIFYFIFHLITPSSKRNLLIIFGSTIFYSWWLPSNTWVPFFLIFTAFLGYKKLIIENGQKRFITLIISLILIYIPLILFKYSGFLYNSFLAPIFRLEERTFDFAIPLGISFITFTLTSFLVDVYKNQYKERVNLITFLAYILYFPQLIAGPILRPHELIPQLKKKLENKVSLNKISFPILIFTIGCLKKFLFADYISIFVERVFDTNLVNNSFETLLAIYAFSVQIYCDFSGYTDMAVGVSLLLGINLPSNFLSPYQASSITDFWKRWHITLSNFLRDYIYIPLGGNRKGLSLQSRNLIFTMLLGGLWHGASWTFVIWGGIHGLGLTLLRLKKEFLENFIRLPRFLSIFLTFNFVSFSWIFFRAKTITKSFEIFNQLQVLELSKFSQFFSENSFPIILIIFFLFTHRWDTWQNLKEIAKNLTPRIFIPLVFILWLIIISFASSSSGAFIYFDF